MTGRELDALIAEKVMGFVVNRREGGPWHLVGAGFQFHGRCCGSGLPKYSEDISAAWEVVVKMREVPAGTLNNFHMVGYAYNRTYAAFVPGLPEEGDYSEGNGEHCTPLAICLAALKAVDAKVAA